MSKCSKIRKEVLKIDIELKHHYENRRENIEIKYLKNQKKIKMLCINI